MEFWFNLPGNQGSSVLRTENEMEIEAG